MHDAFGRELKVGDRVIVAATVTALHGGEDHCNVTLQSAIGRRPDGALETLYAINTGVLICTPDHCQPFWENLPAGGARMLEPAEAYPDYPESEGDGAP